MSKPGLGTKSTLCVFLKDSVDEDMEPIAFLPTLRIACLILASPLSCCRAVSAAWHSHPALAQHSRETLEDDTRDSSREKGQIQRSAFCAQVVFHTLPEKFFRTELKTLSDILQNRKTALPKARDIITMYVKYIERLSGYPGQHVVDTSQAKEVMEFKAEQLRVGSHRQLW